MSFNPISISGYHMREAGATAVQEVGFTLANALEYVRVAVDAGLAVDSFGPRLSFFFASHNDLFEEAAKFRAARRLWARLVRERFGGRRRDRAASVPHPDRRRHAPGAAAAQQRRAGDGPGAGRGAGRHPVAAHQRLRRGAGAARPPSRPRWRSGPSRSSATRAGWPRSSIRSAGSYYVEASPTAIEAEARDADRGSGRARRGGRGRSSADSSRRRSRGARTSCSRRRSRASGWWSGSTGSPTTRRHTAIRDARLLRARGATSAPGWPIAQAAPAEPACRHRSAGLSPGAPPRHRALMPPILDAVRARATLGEISDTLAERLGRCTRLGVGESQRTRALPLPVNRRWSA